MEKAIVYKKFHTLEEAKEIIDLLEEHKIYHEIEDNSLAVSELFVGQTIDPKIRIKVYPKDFDALNRLVENNADIDLEQIEKDHYLFSFDNTELYEIIAQPDKWSALDYQMAKKILISRGETISDHLTNALKDFRTNELKQKEKGYTIWTVVGYILALLGGIIGIAIGLHLWFSKKTLPNGTRIYSYIESDRKHGQAISIIGIGMFVFYIYLQIK